MKRSVLRTELQEWSGSLQFADMSLGVLDQAVAAGTLPPWDPEEPEGFREWFERWDTDGGPVPDIEGAALAGWNARLAHQEAQQRTIEPKVDPGVRCKEIEAQIDAWAEELHSRGSQSLITCSIGFLGGEVRHLLRRLGVL